MKKIQHFCDKCKNLIATERRTIGFQEAKYLVQVGRQEWCDNCVEELRKTIVDINQIINVNDSDFS